MEIIKFIQSFYNPFFDQLFQVITMLGEDYFFIAAGTLIYWCIDKGFGYRLVFAYLSNGLVNTTIKQIVKVPRPFERDSTLRVLRRETAGGYSFPSGHTQCTSSFWTSMMLQIKYRWMYFSGIILIILVGISRMYLGVHTPEDVLAGAVIGAVWVMAVNRMFDFADRTGKKSVFLIVIIPAVTGMLIFRNSDYYKVAGTVISFYIGYLIETAYINFPVKTVFWKQVIKYITGMLVILLVKIPLKSLLPEGMISDFIRYFMMGAWVTMGAPCIIKYVLCRKKETGISVEI